MERETPKIRVVDGNLDGVVNEAEQALLDAAAPIFQRGGGLVRVVTEKVACSNGDMFLTARLSPINNASKHWLAEQLTRHARFEVKRKKGWKPADCPMKVVETLLARGEWGFRVLAGLSNAPSLMAEGRAIEIEGYDPSSHLILDFNGTPFPRIPERPSRVDAQRAYQVLLEAFDTFPYEDDVGRAVTIAALCTALARRSLPAAPLFAVSATTPGSGKSLLVDAVAAIATGRPCPVLAPGRTTEEFDKRLDGTLKNGDSIVSFDNVDRPIDSGLFCQILTQPFSKIRPLGMSDQLEVPTSTTFLATGNNLRVVGDLTRRCLVVLLDPKHETPEERSFKRDAVEYVIANRPSLVIAALTMMRAYLVGGETVGLKPIGSYSAWSKMVREPIVWAGGADPVKSMAYFKSADPQLEQRRAFMCAWAKVIGGKATTTAAVIKAAAGEADLNDAMLAIGADRRGGISANRVGNWLASNAGRQFKGARFEKLDNLRHGVAMWRLVGYGGLLEPVVE